VFGAVNGLFLGKLVGKADLKGFAGIMHKGFTYESLRVWSV
jgi:hypothetical protein